MKKAVGDKITVTANTTVTAVWENISAEHTCDLKPVIKVEPSCTEGGKEAYYKCEGCGKFFEDALGAKEITDIDAWGNIKKNDHSYGTEWKSDKDNHWNECVCGDKADTAAHKDENKDGKCDVCIYNVGLPVDSDNPADPDNPQTGDSNLMWLWITLLFVSGFGMVAMILLNKRKTVK